MAYIGEESTAVAALYAATRNAVRPLGHAMRSLGLSCVRISHLPAYRLTIGNTRLPDNFKRIYYYHVRKTGGTSLAHAFLALGGEDPGLVERRMKHAPFCTASGEYRFVYEDLPLLRRGYYLFGYGHKPAELIRLPDQTFTFTILRDPIDRVVSLYRYLADPRADEGQAFPAPAYERDWARSGFGEFLDMVSRAQLLNQIYTFSRAGSVTEATERILGCDRIMRTRDLDSGIRELAAYLRLPLKVRRVRQSRFDYQPTESETDRLRELLEPEYQLLSNLANQFADSTVLRTTSRLVQDTDLPGVSATLPGPIRCNLRGMTNMPAGKLDLDQICADVKERSQIWSRLLNQVDARCVAELGVWRGELAAELLRVCPKLERYYMIDPWRHLDDWNKPANRSDTAFEEIMAEAMRRTDFAADRRVVLRGRSADVLHRIPDHTLDFAYVDSDHSLRGITIDLHRILPKMKPGSWIGGDDFGPTVWQHASKYEPTFVFPYAVYFAEAIGAHIYALGLGQFLISLPVSLGEGSGGPRFVDRTGRYGSITVASALRRRRLWEPAIRGAVISSQRLGRRTRAVLQR